jgi:hypothetical protein
MSLRFQKRISILPGVRLNISPSGISTTLGIPGASVTLGGRDGAHANFGLPGSGLSLRIPLAGQPEPRTGPPATESVPGPERGSPALPNIEIPPSSPPMQAVRSADIRELTTRGLAAFRDVLIEARRGRVAAERHLNEVIRRVNEADRAVRSARAILEQDERFLAELEASFFRFLKRGKIAATKTAIEQDVRRSADAEATLKTAREEQAAAEERLEQLSLDIDFQIAPDASAVWMRVQEAFEKLARSVCIWDITASRSKRVGHERSIATEIVDRKPTQLSLKELEVINCRFTPLCWRNANGGDMYLYPGFIIVFDHGENFAMLELKDIEYVFTPARFQEAEKIPADAKRVGTTWRYTNKNGTPDRRYIENPEMPIMLYGEVHWKSATGLNEIYQFSDAESAAKFVDTLNEFRNTVRLTHSQ